MSAIKIIGECSELVKLCHINIAVRFFEPHCMKPTESIHCDESVISNK